MTTLLADDGTKLSKKLRNYTEPTEIFEKQGAQTADRRRMCERPGQPRAA